MVDTLMEVDRVSAARLQQARRLHKAMQRTQRLLDSPAAADKDLAKIWNARLQAQQRNMIGICK